MENKIKKDGFIMYSSHWAAMSLFTDEEMGVLMKSVYKYYLYNTIPEFNDKSLTIMFNLIKEVLDKDNLKYVNKCYKTKESLHVRNSEHPDVLGVNSNLPSYSTDKNKDKEKYKKREDIDKSTDINFFIKEFSKIRGKTVRATNYIQNAFYKRINEGYTVDDMLITLKNMMKEDIHVNENFKRLTPTFVLKQETLEIYTVLKNNYKSEDAAPQTPTLGIGEWITGGVRYYQYMNETYRIPADAPTRPGTRYVYDHEKRKWVMPGNF